ncbi:hypothetical protein NDU88_001624 [Pleurodeles waltl]|uniref:Uncharacterized protein n=1 Tax=Pleurodeles waltl TaxID=8319 RepID=A0AAV7U7E6_PLEWA|nr:hypothetical protein NDU88_001624 [Pleurodeles waltl]
MAAATLFDRLGALTRPAVPKNDEWYVWCPRAQCFSSHGSFYDLIDYTNGHVVCVVTSDVTCNGDCDMLRDITRKVLNAPLRECFRCVAYQPRNQRDGGGSGRRAEGAARDAWLAPDPGDARGALLRRTIALGDARALLALKN